MGWRGGGEGGGIVRACTKRVFVCSWACTKGVCVFVCACSFVSEWVCMCVCAVRVCA